MKSIVAAFTAVFGVGYLGYTQMPLLLEAVGTHYTLDDAGLGLVATSLLLGLALGLFLSTPLLASGRPRRLSLGGAAVAVLGYGLAALEPAYGVLVACLFTGGLGMGACLAGGDAIVAGSDNPDRLFAGIIAAGNLLAIGLLLAVMPAAIGSFGMAGGFGAMTLVTLLLLAVLFHTLPRGVLVVEEVSTGDAGLWLLLSPVVLALLLVGLADSSVWTFTAVIAVDLGMDQQQAGIVMAVALFGGVLGSALSALVATRFGRVIPIILSMLVLATGYAGVLAAPSANVYFAAQVTALFAFGFVVPYLFGLCGSLDPKGRLMAAGAGMQMIGFAVSPFISGNIITQWGLTPLAALAAGYILLSMILALRANRASPGITQGLNP